MRIRAKISKLLILATISMILLTSIKAKESKPKGKLLSKKGKKKSKPKPKPVEDNQPSMEAGIEDEEWGVLSDSKIASEEQKPKEETKSAASKKTQKKKKSKNKPNKGR